MYILRLSTHEPLKLNKPNEFSNQFFFSSFETRFNAAVKLQCIELLYDYLFIAMNN